MASLRFRSYTDVSEQLEELTLVFLDTQSEIDHILGLLCSTDLSFAETLQRLQLTDGTMMIKGHHRELFSLK